VSNGFPFPYGQLDIVAVVAANHIIVISSSSSIISLK